MYLCFEELCRKEVIDIRTGERLGFIDDIELDLNDSSVKSLVIYGGARLLGLLGREKDTVISCSDIKVVGSEVVLVELSKTDNGIISTNYKRKRFLSLLK